jgi:hypothetical protein
LSSFISLLGKTKWMSFEGFASSTWTRSPSISFEWGYFCRCFFRIEIISIALQPVTPSILIPLGLVLNHFLQIWFIINIICHVLTNVPLPTYLMYRLLTSPTLQKRVFAIEFFYHYSHLNADKKRCFATRIWNADFYFYICYIGYYSQ